MPPHSEEAIPSLPVSSLGIKPPKTRELFVNVYTWLEDKKADDGAEGLWRIHDELYDFSDFIKQHPGGQDWLVLTKGTDITEAFEAHHITTVPDGMLSKYYKRKAASNRNAPFTFKDDGFYRTLKRRVREVYKNLPKQSSRNTDFFIDSMCLATFLFSILAGAYFNFYLGMFAGSLLAWTTIAAHNYFHRRDNFRMYFFNLSGMDYKHWRISHALSHHLHTNTIDDLEILTWEPVFKYLPIKKEFWSKYAAWIYAPLIWITQFHVSFILALVGDIKTRAFNPPHLIPLTTFITMYLIGGNSLFSTFVMWNFIMAWGSLHFFLVGLNAAHHHPDIFHDGDTPRSTDDIDWGISQLDAVVDRVEITGSHWLVLTNFGDHALHHLFPTFDHGYLEHLYPVFQKTLKEFNLNLRFASQATLLKGQFRQLVREKPNPNPPDLFKELK